MSTMRHTGPTDPVVEDRIASWYRTSASRPGYRQCRACRSHVTLGDLRANNGYCPGCEYLSSRGGR